MKIKIFSLPKTLRRYIKSSHRVKKTFAIHITNSLLSRIFIELLKHMGIYTIQYKGIKKFEQDAILKR